MRTLKKHIGVFIPIAGIFLSCAISFADTKLTTYHPAPDGIYKTFRLVEQSVALPNPCKIGSLYIAPGTTLNYCFNDSGLGKWGTITDIWTQNGDDIYLDDTTFKVGIGTKTPEFKLSVSNDAGIIAQGTFADGEVLPDLAGGSQLIWYPRKAALRAGNVSGTQWRDANIGIYSAALGKDSTAVGAYCIVGGGESNTAQGQYSNIIGGQNNQATGDYSAIIGGSNNTVTGQYTIITAGALNSAIANYTTILGGQSNQANAIYATIGGGLNNQVNAPYSSINGGRNNTITAATGYSIIAGGFQNRINHDFSVITGGHDNTTNNPYTGIGGGQNNTAGTITSGSYARVSGGQNNSANTDYSTVGGGLSNTAMGALGYDTVTGGLQNTASAGYSSIGGGERNTASGIYSTVMGGSDNTAAGDYSWAGGRNMQLTNTADQTFVWGYSDTPFSISTSNAFIIAGGTNGASPWWPKVGIRDVDPIGVLEINANLTADNYIEITRTNPGDVFIVKNNGYIGIGRPFASDNSYALQVGTNGTNGNGAYLTGTGQWVSASSQELKENIRPLSSKIADTTLENLVPVTFNYKVNDQTNAGFIAEDVPEIVAIKGRKALSAMDIIAVLTKVAQDQQTQIEQQTKEIMEIQNTITRLKRENPN